MTHSYESRHADWGPLDGAYRRCLRASAEALFPATADGTPDWQTTDLEPRMLRYVDRLPPPQRRLLKLMFISVEFLAVFLSPGLRPFSMRTSARRAANVRAWRASWVVPVRLLGDALKSSLQMVYLSHPAAARYLGEFKSWRRDGDTWPVEVRPAPTVAEYEALRGGRS